MRERSFACKDITAYSREEATEKCKRLCRNYFRDRGCEICIPRVRVNPRFSMCYGYDRPCIYDGEIIYRITSIEYMKLIWRNKDKR